MTARVPGRNDPCPCGSGRKYKRCCIDAPSTDNGQPAGSFPRPDVHSPASEIAAGLSDREFSSMEELEEVIRQRVEARNARPLSNFDGLSPEQMRRLLEAPLASPQLAHVLETLEVEPDGPLAALTRIILEAIDEKGLKLTPKGNLPRALSQDAAKHVMGPAEYASFSSVVKIRSEEDYQDLFVARVLCQQAGLVRKQHGRLFRTRLCDKLTASGSLAAAYPRLFRVASTRFNWGYRDGYPDLWIIQKSFLFTLRLLHRHGDEYRDSAFYEERFLRAFPNAVDTVEDRSWSTPEQIVAQCFRIRALERYAVYLGLAELEAARNRSYSKDGCRLRKRPLLDSVVEFRV